MKGHILNHRQFISVDSVRNINGLIDKALLYKQKPLLDTLLGDKKRIGLIFLNSSLRTRVSTQLAAHHLGLHTIILNMDAEGWALEFQDQVIMNGNKVEHIKDAAPILGKYFDIMAIRIFPTLTNKKKDYNEYCLNQFIKYAGIPIVSLESATLHPLQSLADLITIKEQMSHINKKRPKVVLTWAPHIKVIPHCVANSFSEWMRVWNEADFFITHPPHYELSEKFTKGVPIIYNQEEALADADFIYVKNWSTFSPYGTIHSVQKEWMLNQSRVKRVAPHAKVMHCLPVRRNVELASDILDSDMSLTLEQAGNRVWSVQSVLSEILNFPTQ